MEAVMSVDIVLVSEPFILAAFWLDSASSGHPKSASRVATA